MSVYPTAVNFNDFPVLMPLLGFFPSLFNWSFLVSVVSAMKVSRVFLLYDKGKLIKINRIMGREEEP